MSEIEEMMKEMKKKISNSFEKIRNQQKAIKAGKNQTEYDGTQYYSAPVILIAQNNELFLEMYQIIKQYLKTRTFSNLKASVKLNFGGVFTQQALFASLKIYEDFVLYKNNVIEGVELAKKITRHIITTSAGAAAMWVGGEKGFVLGAAIGGPVVGVVGGVVGALFSGYIVEKYVNKACKYIMDEKEYQLDALEQNHAIQLAKLHEQYSTALFNRQLTDLNTNDQIKKKKKIDLLTFSPDKNPDMSTEQFAVIIAEYQIIKEYRKIRNELNQV